MTQVEEDSPFPGLALELLFWGERRMVVLHEMRRHRQSRAVVRQVLDEQRHRLRKVVAEAVVVVFFEARALEARLNHRH